MPRMGDTRQLGMHLPNPFGWVYVVAVTWTEDGGFTPGLLQTTGRKTWSSADGQACDVVFEDRLPSVRMQRMDGGLVEETWMQATVDPATGFWVQQMTEGVRWKAQLGGSILEAVDWPGEEK